MNFDALLVQSPKRDRQVRTGWEGFFPYYAGYPESFARKVIESSNLKGGSLILDPWNGSGTTTFSAAQLGFKAIGLDLNPVMVIISRARILPFSEADALQPLSKAILAGADSAQCSDSFDPLLNWFDRRTTNTIRAIERSICERLVGNLTISKEGIKLDKLSSIAAAFYVALFAVCRDLTRAFQSSNPTWLKLAKRGERRISSERRTIERRFQLHIDAMANVLSDKLVETTRDHFPVEILLADSTSSVLPKRSVDFILTSPPYCTRIDYTAATRVELAVIAPLVGKDTIELGRNMIGSTRVPKREIQIEKSWGPTCKNFLHQVKSHPSKASDGYYLRTHLDYFDKMARSIDAIAEVLRPTGAAILVVQDSFYKEVHNDLPTITEEIAARRGLVLKRRDNFYFRRSMSGINRSSKTYGRKPGAVESVLCFQK